jgi:osmoprotectant transport system permease protein
MELVAFWTAHASELWGMLGRHVALVAMSTAIAVLIGVPAGVVAAHQPRLGKPLAGFANIAQTIPSLALLGFLLPLPLIGGIGSRVAIVALILYALLPIVRGTMAGLTSVDPVLVAAGTAMGMTARQLLWMVELPLALPSIVAGVRVATVVGVGTATIAAAIGAGGLGEYIFRGLSMVDSTVILAGAIPAALLAISADTLLTWVERLLRPSRRQGGRGRAILAAAVLLLPLLVAAGVAIRPKSNAIVVGSKNFTEQVVLGELLAQALEQRGFEVTRRLNLGGTFICDRALRSGDIDVYPEYTGTALTAIFREAVGRDRKAVLETVRQRYAAAGVSVLPALGFENTFAILVRRADAERLGLRTIGDLQRAPTQWLPGFGFEFIERADGYTGLTAAYGLRFARQPRVMDLALMYRALAAGDVDLIAGDATSAHITSLDLAMLADDRGYFPPYDAIPLARSAMLLRHPDARAALETLAGRISAEDMRALNHAVDVERQDVASVVRRFLAKISTGRAG